MYPNAKKVCDLIDSNTRVLLLESMSRIVTVKDLLVIASAMPRQIVFRSEHSSWNKLYLRLCLSVCVLVCLFVFSTPGGTAEACGYHNRDVLNRRNFLVKKWV